VRRLLPSSLLGQMLLLMGAALLVAQAVNFAFILNEQQKLSLARSEGPAIGRFTQAAAVVAATPPAGRPLLLSAHPTGPAAAYRLVPESRIDGERIGRNPEIEKRLAAALREARVPVRAVRAASPMGVGRVRGPAGPPPSRGAPEPAPGRPARRRPLARRPLRRPPHRPLADPPPRAGDGDAVPARLRGGVVDRAPAGAARCATSPAPPKASRATLPPNR
jgi:hypothetical protein